MKLFISWSGEFSKRVAERLSIWIPTIIQSVEVFYSPNDIAKGENWGKRLDIALSDCGFGIICLTPENVAAPWIHFEAGALSTALNARISTVMLEVSPSNLKGPLTRYQNTVFERDDFFRLFQSINKSSDTPLKPEILKNAFDHAWENLKAEIEEIIEIYCSSKKETTVENRSASDSDSDSDSNSDALQEILRLVRKIDGQKTVDNTKSAQFPSVSNHMIKAAVFSHGANPEEVFAIIYKYIPATRYTEARSQLYSNYKCECLVPESDVEELSFCLNKIGAHIYFPNVHI